MSRHALLILLLLCALPAGAAPQRVALVIGNNAYNPQTGWSHLDNPANDAATIAAVLRDRLKFDRVILKTDLDRAGFIAALDALDGSLSPGDTVFFYYSGHGAQADDQNYLIPVSAAAPASSRQLRADSVSLNEVLALLQAKGTALNILVLDACRNNPLSADGKSYGGAGLRGLSRVNLQGETLIAFATDPGKVAADGSGRLSPYTQVLSEELAQPGKSLWEVFGAVTARVRDATRDSSNPQTPWKNDTLTRPHYLLAGGPGPDIPPPPPAKADDERIFWQSTEACGSESCYRAYLEAYPQGRFAALARARTQKPEPPKPPPETKKSYEPEMVRIPGGDFRMGCVEGQDCNDDEKPVHPVSISAFALGKTEVTFAQWDACVAAGGCQHKPGDEGWGRGDRPVINVSWDDAQHYLRWLNDKTGKAYRLPTEAEWEYAARAGTTTAYSWGNEVGKNRANCDGCGSRWDNKSTAPVGQFAANAFGLHDLHGNVWEWTADCWHDNYQGAPTDGSAWTAGGDCARRVLRGGSWFNAPWFLRSAFRYRNFTVSRYGNSGFRVARTLTP